MMVGAVARVPTITNVTMTNLDTEYEHILGLHTKKFMVHTRDESAFRLAYETGHVATPVAPYLTILDSCRYYEEDINNEYPAADLLTLYFASDSAGKVIEIVEWV